MWKESFCDHRFQGKSQSLFSVTMWKDFIIPVPYHIKPRGSTGQFFPDIHAGLGHTTSQKGFTGFCRLSLHQKRIKSKSSLRPKERQSFPSAIDLSLCKTAEKCSFIFVSTWQYPLPRKNPTLFINAFSLFHQCVYRNSQSPPSAIL